MNQRINWLPAVFFLLFGAVFFYATTQIGDEYGGGDGGKMLPFAASFCIMVLSAKLVYSAFFSKEDQDSSPSSESIYLKEFLFSSGPLLLLVLTYGLFHIWFGYLLATLLCSVLAFRLFGNTWLSSLIHSLIGSVLLYLLFIKLLRVYDPPGELLDLSTLF